MHNLTLNDMRHLSDLLIRVRDDIRKKRISLLSLRSIPNNALLNPYSVGKRVVSPLVWSHVAVCITNRLESSCDSLSEKIRSVDDLIAIAEVGEAIQLEQPLTEAVLNIPLAHIRSTWNDVNNGKSVRQAQAELTEKLAHEPANIRKFAAPALDFDGVNDEEYEEILLGLVDLAAGFFRTHDFVVEETDEGAAAREQRRIAEVVRAEFWMLNPARQCEELRSAHDAALAEDDDRNAALLDLLFNDNSGATPEPELTPEQLAVEKFCDERESQYPSMSDIKRDGSKVFHQKGGEWLELYDGELAGQVMGLLSDFCHQEEEAAHDQQRREIAAERASEERLQGFYYGGMDGDYPTDWDCR